MLAGFAAKNLGAAVGRAVSMAGSGASIWFNPALKNKPQTGSRRFHVLVYFDKFGIADDWDNLVAETHAVTVTQTLL